MYGEGLAPTALHKLISGKTVWEDGLWDAARAFLAKAMTEEELTDMAIRIYGGERDSYLKLDSYLTDFKFSAPTVLLGAFDLQRQAQAREAYFARPEFIVEQRPLSYYDQAIGQPSNRQKRAASK